MFKTRLILLILLRIWPLTLLTSKWQGWLAGTWRNQCKFRFDWLLCSGFCFVSAIQQWELKNSRQDVLMYRCIGPRLGQEWGLIMQNHSETSHSGTSTHSFSSSAHSCLFFCLNSFIDLVIVQHSESIKMLNLTLMKDRQLQFYRKGRWKASIGIGGLKERQDCIQAFPGPHSFYSIKNEKKDTYKHL